MPRGWWFVRWLGTAMAVLSLLTHSWEQDTEGRSAAHITEGGGDVDTDNVYCQHRRGRAEERKSPNDVFVYSPDMFCISPLPSFHVIHMIILMFTYSTYGRSVRHKHRNLNKWSSRIVILKGFFFFRSGPMYPPVLTAENQHSCIVVHKRIRVWLH